MTANEKIKAFGEEAIADAERCSVSIVYRWRKALERGEGIGREAMVKLIRATAGSEHAIVWGDFEPEEFRASREAAA